jgi:hypothetical protein
VQDFERHYEQLVVERRAPASVGNPEDVRALTARARLKLGDTRAAYVLLRLCLSSELSARQTAEEALVAAFGTPNADEPAVAIDVRRALDELPDVRAQHIEVLQTAAQAAVEDAERTAERAATASDRMAALARFDEAELAVGRYRTIAPRSFTQDLERVRLGADGLSAQLASDDTFRGSIPWRDLLAPSERRRWTQNGGVSVRYEGDAAVLEAADDAGGSFSFALGNPSDPSAGEQWRDYELGFEVDVARKGLWLLDRYDSTTATSETTVMAGAQPDVPGIVFAAVEEGRRYRVEHSVLGSELRHTQTDLGEARAPGAAAGDGAGPSDTPAANNGARAGFDNRATIRADVRKGTLVLQLEPGAKVAIRDLKVRVLRADAAWGRADLRR